MAGPDADAVALQAMRAAANLMMENEENQQRLAVYTFSKVSI
jgi:hypothetical protein